MKFKVTADYLAPIELGRNEWVEIILPDERRVTVFDDRIYVATENDALSHLDGKRIWDAGSPSHSPYGIIRPLKPKEAGDAAT